LHEKSEAPKAFPHVGVTGHQPDPSESKSSATQNIEHAAKRIGIDIGIDADAFSAAKIDFDQATPLLSRSGWSRR
jgi:hypothetical protein